MALRQVIDGKAVVWHVAEHVSYIYDYLGSIVLSYRSGEMHGLEGLSQGRCSAHVQSLVDQVEQPFHNQADPLSHDVQQCAYMPLRLSPPHSEHTRSAMCAEPGDVACPNWVAGQDWARLGAKEFSRTGDRSTTVLGRRVPWTRS